MHPQLIEVLAAATSIPDQAIEKALTRPKDSTHGDFSFPCFLLAKEWKLSPPQVAAKLKEMIVLPKDISRVEVVGPYLNFFLDRAQSAATTLQTILKEGPRVGSQPLRNETIVVDYSGPNIAKPFHVGHLRTMLIGHSLCKVLKHRGYTPVGVNHLGDWGTQFGFVYAGYLLAGKPATFTVYDLVNYYVRAANLRKAQDEGRVPAEDAQQPNIGDIAKEYFVQLEADDPQAFVFWQRCLDVSVEYFKQIYSRLGIEFDHYHGESFYRGILNDVEERIKASGILEESRGARGVNLQEPLGYVRIFAEDGRSLYIARDIACALYRNETFTPQKILYVVAAQQSLHFQQLTEIFRRLNHPVAGKIVHVAFGFVPGMKTREGNVITLEAFLEEAHTRARAVYEQEVDSRPAGVDGDRVAEAVAVGAIYFYFLSHSNGKDLQFRWEQALTFQGDTGPYIQYAYARLNSIELRAREAGIVYSESFDATLLSEDSAHELISLLARFDATLQRVLDDYEPSHLADLLLEISRSLARSYKELRVIGAEPAHASARLALFTASKHVLRTGMELLGMPPIERM